MAPADAGALHALRRRRSVGPIEANVGAASVSDRRCRGPSCVSWRMDLDAPLQQRPHERRRGADRSGRGRARSSRWRARHGAVCWRPLPSVADQFRSSRAVLPFVHAPRLAFRSARVAGPVVGASAVGRRRDRSAALDRLSADPARHPAPASIFWSARRRVPTVTRPSSRTSRRRWRNWTRPNALSPRCTRRWTIRRSSSGSSLLYFAAASFSEAARRLGRPELAPGFLLSAHPTFGPELAACASAAAAPLLRVPHGAPSKRASIARSNRSIRPVSSIAGGGTGIPSSRRISWRRRRSWTPHRTRSPSPRAHRHDPGRDLTRRATMTGAGSCPIST